MVLYWYCADIMYGYLTGAEPGRYQDCVGGVYWYNFCGHNKSTACVLHWCITGTVLVLPLSCTGKAHVVK